jgi:subtilisin family serine protease
MLRLRRKWARKWPAPGVRGSAVLAVLGCAVSLAVLPGTPASADIIQVDQQWILNMMNVPAAWQETQGGGVTVAVIDSGVNPDVSDLAGSVVTGPDYTGVSTKPSNPDWGVHGTWMASLIAGHGHDGGDSGVIGVAPHSTILSIRVIPDRADPHYGRYSREQEPDIQNSLAQGIDYAVRHGAKVISMSIGYSAPNGAVKQALAGAYSRGVVVVASAGNSGAPGGTSDGSQAPESRPRAGTASTGGSVAPARPAPWWPGSPP